MKRFFLHLLTVLLAVPVFAQPATLDDTARFLAGIPVGGPLATLTHDPAWLDHARNLDSAWFKKDYFQIRPIRAWMLANAPDAPRPRPAKSCCFEKEIKPCGEVSWHS